MLTLQIMYAESGSGGCRLCKRQVGGLTGGRRSPKEEEPDGW